MQRRARPRWIDSTHGLWEPRVGQSEPKPKPTPNPTPALQGASDGIDDAQDGMHSVPAQVDIQPGFLLWRMVFTRTSALNLNVSSLIFVESFT